MLRLAVMTETGKGKKGQKEWSSLPREKGQVIKSLRDFIQRGYAAQKKENSIQSSC